MTYFRRVKDKRPFSTMSITRCGRFAKNSINMEKTYGANRRNINTSCVKGENTLYFKLLQYANESGSEHSIFRNHSLLREASPGLFDIL